MASTLEKFILGIATRAESHVTFEKLEITDFFLVTIAKAETHQDRCDFNITDLGVQFSFSKTNNPKITKLKIFWFDKSWAWLRVNYVLYLTGLYCFLPVHPHYSVVLKNYCFYLIFFCPVTLKIIHETTMASKLLNLFNSVNFSSKFTNRLLAFKAVFSNYGCNFLLSTLWWVCKKNTEWNFIFIDNFYSIHRSIDRLFIF